MMENATTELLTELIPGLPQELGLECLTRLHYSAHPLSAQACRRWRHLLLSRDFYNHRKQTGHTRRLACFLQSLVQPGPKPSCPLAYGVTVFDPVSGSWERLEPLPEYPDGLPLFCQLASSEGKLVVMGGWDPSSYKPVKDVFVYEFTTRRWRRGKEMPESRTFFAAGGVEGRVVVAGGHDENKNAMRSAWAYDVAGDEWAELGRLSEGRDECEGVVVGSEFWVVSGYWTEKQGRFEASAEVLEARTGKWRRVEEAWREGQFPRACVRVGRDGKFGSWDEYDEAVRVGACGVQLGETMTLVSGSSYQGGPLEIIMVEEGQKGKKMNVPRDFSGYIQSGCCVEI